MKRLTREWVRKAESDFVVGSKLALERDRHHDEVCFHAQQCAEKYLKALLEELGQPVPRTHIVEDLVVALVPYHFGLRSLRRGGKFLSRFAVAIRYPGETATKRQAVSALKWAQRFRNKAHDLLKIKPPKP